MFDSAKKFVIMFYDFMISDVLSIGHNPKSNELEQNYKVNIY